MGKSFYSDDLNQALFLPPSLHDWLPEKHLARFTIAFRSCRRQPLKARSASRARFSRPSGPTTSGPKRSTIEENTACPGSISVRPSSSAESSKEDRYAAARKHMVQRDLIERGLKNPRVLEAF